MYVIIICFFIVSKTIGDFVYRSGLLVGLIFISIVENNQIVFTARVINIIKIDIRKIIYVYVYDYHINNVINAEK